MATRVRHYMDAEDLLAEGVGVVKKISILADARRKLADDNEFGTNALAIEAMTELMDEYGKKAMGIWAQAQVHATLATAEGPVVSSVNATRAKSEAVWATP